MSAVRRAEAEKIGKFAVIGICVGALIFIAQACGYVGALNPSGYAVVAGAEIAFCLAGFVMMQAGERKVIYIPFCVVSAFAAFLMISIAGWMLSFQSLSQ